MLAMTLILLALLALLVVVYIGIFNGLRTAETRVQQGWAGIEVQLHRRHDLTPQLVQAVRKALGHEHAIFEKLTSARLEAISALQGHDPEAMAQAEAKLAGTLRSIYALSESNPEITATGNIETFQRQLEETEDQIAAARRLYNGNVQALNARIRTFPGNFIAGPHGIRLAKPFEIPEARQEEIYAVPKMQL